MKVSFTKTDAGRYSVMIAPARGAAPVPRQASGYDDHLPHDLAQLLIEEELDIRHGIYGHLGTGAAGTSIHPDVIRSERLVAMCVPLWQARAGRMPNRPAIIDMTLASPFDIDRVLHRFDEVSAQWAALAIGEPINVQWSAGLQSTFA